MAGGLEGWAMYLVGLLTMAGIYAVLALGLNLQWGVTGLFNAGIAGFFAIGAYVSAILTTSGNAAHLGGFGLPAMVGPLGALAVSGLVAYGVGRLCLGVRGDYLAIVTIGIAEIFRLILKNEAWLTNGTRGIANVPRPFETLGHPMGQVAFLLVVVATVLIVYVALERGLHSPWGRVMRAIRENETAAAAAGKDVARFRLQAFVIGSAVMGVGGALAAQSFKFIGPEATEPLMTTFLVWVMVIVGGSGNNKGAVLGALVVWTIWSATELLTARLPPDWITRASYIRVFLIGLLLQVMLQRFARGLIPERIAVPTVSRTTAGDADVSASPASRPPTR